MFRKKSSGWWLVAVLAQTVNTRIFLKIKLKFLALQTGLVTWSGSR